VTADGWGAERALADALGGYAGGWAFWRAGLEAVAIAVERSRGREGAFCSYPSGELNRLGRDVLDALELLATAVAVQDTINGDGADPAGSIADVLRQRVRAIADRAG
jgi:hypothetical protein